MQFWLFEMEYFRSEMMVVCFRYVFCCIMGVIYYEFILNNSLD